MKYSWPLQSVVVFRPDPTGAKVGHGGNPHLNKTLSSDRGASATNRMHSSDLVALGRSIFLFHSEY